MPGTWNLEENARWFRKFLPVYSNIMYNILAIGNKMDDSVLNEERGSRI